MLAESGIPADPSRLYLRLEADPARAGATVIHPGAASPARRWPAERFAAVARHEAAGGRRVLITGGPGEVELAARVGALAGLPDEDVVAGGTDAMGLARIVAGAARVVCSDTGVAHLATALGSPSLVIFGPTPPTHWGPPADDPRHRALWAGRTGDPHAAALDEGLARIGVEEALETLARLPGRDDDDRRVSRRRRSSARAPAPSARR